MIDQITVFLENEKGHLASLCRTLGDAGVNMHALMVADTTDFGVVRIICDAPTLAKTTLESNGYRASITPVAAVEVPDTPGGLADILECLENSGINVEYAYCFSTASGKAADVLKIHGDGALDALTQAGFNTLQPKDLYVPDELN